MLIYADPEHLGDQDQQITSATQTLYVAPGAFFNWGFDKTSALTSTISGKLTVVLVGEQWEKTLHAHKQRR